jgi:hypothetical protein
MPTLYESVKTDIANAVTGILPGGIFDSNEIFEDNAIDGGGYKWAKRKGLFNGDNVTLKSHGIIRWSDSKPHQAEHPKLRAEREYFEIYLYQNIGYSDIDAAKEAIKEALHNKKYRYTSDKGLAHVLYEFFSKELKAPDYQNKPMKILRFGVIWR